MTTRLNSIDYQMQWYKTIFIPKHGLSMVFPNSLFRKWLEDQGCVFEYKQGKIRFKSEAAATMFILKWGAM